MAIKYRQELGRPLTYAEGDENFRTLEKSVGKTLEDFPTLAAALVEDPERPGQQLVPDGVVFTVNDGIDAGYWRRDSSDEKGAVFLREHPIEFDLERANENLFNPYDGRGVGKHIQHGAGAPLIDDPNFYAPIDFIEWGEETRIAGKWMHSIAQYDADKVYIGGSFRQFSAAGTSTSVFEDKADGAHYFRLDTGIENRHKVRVTFVEPGSYNPTTDEPFAFKFERTKDGVPLEFPIPTDQISNGIENYVNNEFAQHQLKVEFYGLIDDTVNSGAYFQGDGLFRVRNGSYLGVDNLDITAADLEPILGGKTGIEFGLTSSYLNLDNCMRINNQYALVYDIKAKQFDVQAMYFLQPHHLTVAASYGTEGIRFSPSVQLHHLRNKVNTLDLLNTVSIGLYSVNDNDIVLEESKESDGNIWVKSNSNQFAFKVRGIPIASPTWSAFKSDILDTSPSAIFETSPKGTPDCLRLTASSIIGFNLLTNDFILTNESNIKPFHYPVIHCGNDGRLGGRTRDVSLIAYTARQNAPAGGGDMSENIAATARPYATSDRFNFIHFSDIHHSGRNAAQNMDELIDFSKKEIIDDTLDAVLFTGDACDGYAGRNKATTLTELETHKNKMLLLDVPTLPCIGNHDDNINFLGAASGANTFARALLKSEQYQTQIQPLADKWSAINDVADKGYYFIDFPENKIRVVTLDCYDLPIVDDGTGELKYKGHEYYSQAQLDWLYNTLQSTPNDYGLIIANHNPFFQQDTAPMQGIELIPTIVDAYKNGTTYSHNYDNSTYPELSTSKEFVFTEQKEFIAHFCGHRHWLEFGKAEGFPDQHCIMANAACASGPYRPLTEVAKNSFNIVSIDRDERKIFVTVFGDFRHRDGKVLDRVTILDY